MIYQAITTKYVGPTNTKGGRIIATTESGIRHTISYPHELSSEEGHRKAAEELRDQLGWHGELIAGGMRHGYCFVFRPVEQPVRATRSLRSRDKIVPDNVKEGSREHLDKLGEFFGI